MPLAHISHLVHYIIHPRKLLVFFWISPRPPASILLMSKPKPETPENPLDQEIAAMSLEACFEELEQIVESLENQTTSLEDSINLFERGMKLSRRCNTELTRMERRIQLIVEDAKKQVVTRDFEEE